MQSWQGKQRHTAEQRFSEVQYFPKTVTSSPVAQLRGVVSWVHALANRSCSVSPSLRVWHSHSTPSSRQPAVTAQNSLFPISSDSCSAITLSSLLLLSHSLNISSLLWSCKIKQAPPPPQDMLPPQSVMGGVSCSRVHSHLFWKNCLGSCLHFLSSAFTPPATTMCYLCPHP